MKNSIQLKGKSLEEINLSLLYHPRLVNNPVFQNLKAEVENYYNERKDKLTERNFQPHNWKNRFFTSLHGLLNEVVYTDNPEIQLQLLGKVKAWYENKLLDNTKFPEIKSRTIEIKDPEAEDNVKPLEEPKIISKDIERKIESPSRITPYIPKAIKIIEKPNKQDKIIKSDMFGLKLPKRSKTAWMNRPKTTIKMLREKRAMKNEPKNSDSSSDDSEPSNNIPQIKDENQSFTTQDGNTRIYNFKLKSLSLSYATDHNSDSPNNSPLLPHINHAYSSTYEPDVLPNKKEERKSFMSSMDSSCRSSSTERHVQTAFPMSRDHNSQLNELISIKNKLASKKLPCTMDVLEIGLLSTNRDIEIAFDPANLPRGGEMLINNPFLKIKKKKGKKKGKKKKKL
ncbi:unnamed protein product [Blepharisma stoltei]|uniref:Uncharacterized protein n=1 Tax=Blepharisma stoltei TaxID=1481888 RepID=A0AAU9KBH7_9CILI|nr:unnamed protein product [Blepharisma stoltei]